VEYATAGRELMSEDVAASGRNPPPAPPGWWQRMKRVAESFLDLLHDEGSGAIDAEPGERGLLAEVIFEGIEAGKSFAHRVREKGREIWSNQRGSVPDTPFDAIFEAIQAGELEDDEDTPDYLSEPDGPDLDNFDR
jgi:hypothetical protein